MVKLQEDEIKRPLVNQPTWLPTEKVAAGGVGGALSIVLVYALGEFGVNMPNEVAQAITVLVAGVFAYFKRNRVV